MSGQSNGHCRACPDEAARLQEQTVFLTCRIERVETFRAAATGASVARKMNGLILAFNVAGIRYLLVGGQAMRHAGIALLDGLVY